MKEWNLSSASGSRKFDKNMHELLKEKAAAAINGLTVTCPNCNTKVEIAGPSGVCPVCGKEIKIVLR